MERWMVLGWYYSDGQLAYRSTNKIGHLVDIKVWKPDGSICEESNVMEGSGSFFRYFEDGSIEHKESLNMAWKPPGDI